MIVILHSPDTKKIILGKTEEFGIVGEALKGEKLIGERKMKPARKLILRVKEIHGNYPVYKVGDIIRLIKTE